MCVCVCVCGTITEKAVNLLCLTLRLVSLLNFVVKESLVLGSGSETVVAMSKWLDLTVCSSACSLCLACRRHE